MTKKWIFSIEFLGWFQHFLGIWITVLDTIRIIRLHVLMFDSDG